MEVGGLEGSEDKVKVMEVFFFCLGVDEYVIDEGNNEFVEIGAQYVVHEAHKG